MALSGGMSCVKYLLFCFNLLFAITGLIILIVGAKAEFNTYLYTDLTNENFYNAAPIVFIVVGVIIFIVAFFGCFGALKENHCMIITFSVLLLIIFVAELAVGVAGYMMHSELEANVVKQLNQSISNYPLNKNVKASFDILQTDLHCCGVNSPSDWAAHGLPIPDSCCAAREVGAAGPVPCSPVSPDFHSDGCLPGLLVMLRSAAYILGGVGIGIAFVQLVGVIFACCLARSVRSQYETV